MKPISQKSQSSTVSEFMARRRISRATIYAEIAAGRLRTYKVGRRRYITDEAERDWIKLLESEAESAPK